MSNDQAPPAPVPEKRRTPGKKKRSRLRRLGRLLLLVTLLLIVALAAAWVWLESAAGQDRARRWLQARGTQLLQRDLTIASLDWDLLPFRARLSGIEIAGAPGSDQPLARIASVQVRIWPWALLSRELRLQSIEVTSPTVHWDTGSGSNLALEARGNGRLGVDVQRLEISDGAVELNHRRWNLDASLAAVSLYVEPVAGAGDSSRRSGLLRAGGGGLDLEAPLVDNADAVPARLEVIEAEVPFLVEEDRLVIEPARLAMGDSELTATGTVTDWSSAELAVGGRIDIRDMVGLTGVALADTDSGMVTLDGAVTWGPEPLHFSGALSSPTITLGGVEGTGLTADVEADAARLVVDELRFGLFDGEVVAAVEASLATVPRQWTLRYEVNDVDMNALSRSPALPGFRFAGIASSRGDLSWSDPVRDTVSGAGSVDLSLPSGTLESLAERAADTGEVPATAPSAREQAATPGGASAQLVAPSLPLPVTAHADFEVDAGTLTVRNGSASLPNTVASLQGSLGRDGTIVADVDVDSDDLRMLDRFFNQIRRFRGEQPVPRPFGLVGSGRVTASVGGTTEQPTVSGSLQARSLSVAGNPVGDVDGSLRLESSSLEIEDLRLRRNDGTGEGGGRLRIGTRAGDAPDYSFELRLESFPMEVNLPQLGTPLTASAETSGEISLSGSYGGPPIGRVALRADGAQLNGLTDLRADVEVRLEPEEWVADRFEISGPSGSIDISGSWLRADDTVQAQLDARDVDASTVNDLIVPEIPLSGTMQLQAQLTGPFSSPDAAATLRWTEAGAYGVALGAVALSTELRRGAVAVSAVGRSDSTAPAVPPPTPHATGGENAIPLDTVPPGGWAATFSADVGAPHRATVRAAGASDLALALLVAQGYDPGQEVTASGSIDASGSGVIGEWADWTGSVELSDFVLSRPGMTFSIPDALRLELGNGLLRVDLPELVSEAGSLQASGLIDVGSGEWIEARSTGVVSLAVVGALSEGLDADGTLEVDLEATGDVLAGDVAGSFELYDVRLAHADSPWAVSGVNGTVLLSDNILDLRDVSGLIEEQPFAIDGTLPLAALAGDESSTPFDVSLTVDALPLAPLWRRTGALNELITGGTAAVTASLQGRGTDWRSYEGDVEVRSLRVDFADLQLTMPQSTTLTLAGDRLELNDTLGLQGPATDLQVSGAFMFAPFRLDARLQGTAALDPFNTITGSWGVAGRAQLDVRVTGNPPELAYNGTLGVTSGLLNAPVLQPVENITAELTLQDRLVRIDRFNGSLGDSSLTDSNVSMGGEIQLVNSVPQRFSLTLDVNEAVLRIQRGTRLTASADLALDGTFERALLSGRMDIAGGEYTARWEDEESMLAMSDAGGPLIDSPLARAINLDIDVVAPGDLRIANNMADVELSADLQIRGTLANPVLLGSATVLDGSVTFNDNRYRFLRGALDFQNPLRTEPTFDISVETSIRQYLVTVNASGSPARGDINTTISSSPPLSDLQLIQLLTTGSAGEENVRNDDQTISALGTQAASFLTRQYMQQVERGAQRVFGVDRFDIQPAVVSGTGDPTARVTVGKQVTPELWVSWTTVLGTTEEQLVTLEYQLTRGIQLTATREDDGSYGVDIRFNHRFR
ncbi:MAG: translocation/assembly module TamB domain-containing protein [Acidobacteriota bacterium]|jgi:autotransporter translocation and assembly factor TamB